MSWSAFSPLELWEMSTPEERQPVREAVLREYFERAAGGNILGRIRDAKRDDVAITDFLDALTVTGMLQAMSAEFGTDLRTRVETLKKFKKLSMEKTVDASGKTIHALEQRGELLAAALGPSRGANGIPVAAEIPPVNGP